jgi:DNA-binding transcriptional MerR regulator
MDVARFANVHPLQAVYWELRRHIVPVARTRSGRLLYDEAQVSKWLKTWRPQHEAWKARQPKKRQRRAKP